MQDARHLPASRKRWMRRTCSTSSTPPAPPANRRASSTPPAAISPASYATTKWVFDLKDEDVYWCTADIGWVTGHSYVVYGPLANGATVVMYEGAPDWPEQGSLLGDRRALRRHDLLHGADRDPRVHALGHRVAGTQRSELLRLLGSVGEPINPEAWMWYHEHIGGERCPIVDTWWQTETGMIMITPLPGMTTTKPGSATQPFPGISAEIRTQDGDARRGRRRPAHADEAVAGDAARHLRRSRALRQAVLQPVEGRRLLHRRRREEGRRRLLLAARPRRRRAERRGSSHRHDGSRERAGRSPARRRGGGRRPRARDQGAGDRGVRHAEGRHPWAARRWSTN